MKKLSETYKELGVDFTFPIEINDANDNETYYENSDGYWSKHVYDANGNVTYFEDSDCYWIKCEYDANGNKIYHETSDGYRKGTPLSQNANSALSSAPCSHICDECKGLLDGYFTGRMHLDGFDVRMKCKNCGKEELNNEPVNIGMGKDVTIRELAEMIKRVVGYQGALVFDTSKPDGTPRKLLDVAKINRLGWQAKITLEDGITRTCKWYKKHLAETNV